jgi:hypothetical protein
MVATSTPNSLSSWLIASAIASTACLEAASAPANGSVVRPRYGSAAPLTAFDLLSTDAYHR